MPRPSVREKIVKAALETLLQKGFNGCGVQDITACAGVPKGSFYNHFKSKEALGAEVVERYCQASRMRLDLLADESIAPRARLRQYFAAQVEALVEAKLGSGCLLGNLAAEMSEHSPLIRERVAAKLSEWTRGIERAIRAAQAAGEISTGSTAEQLAAFLVNAWEGAVLRSRADQSRAPLDTFLQITFERVLT